MSNHLSFQGLLDPISGSGPLSLFVAIHESSWLSSLSLSLSTETESSSSVDEPYFDDLVSEDLFELMFFFLFSPSLSSSSSSLPPFELESEAPLRLGLEEIGVFEAGWDGVLGLSFDFELFDDELPEFEALSLDDEFYPAFWMILSWVVEI